MNYNQTTYKNYTSRKNSKICININLVSFITLICSIKVNLTLPYRKPAKKSNRTSSLLQLLQLFLVLSGDFTNQQSTSNYFNHSTYETPFSEKNILNIFSSESLTTNNQLDNNLTINITYFTESNKVKAWNGTGTSEPLHHNP